MGYHGKSYPPRKPTYPLKIVGWKMIHVLIKWSRTSKNILVFRGLSFFSRGFLLDFVVQEQLQAAMQLSLEASMAAPVPEELGENGWRLKAPKTP